MGRRAERGPWSGRPLLRPIARAACDARHSRCPGDGPTPPRRRSRCRATAAHGDWTTNLALLLAKARRPPAARGRRGDRRRRSTVGPDVLGAATSPGPGFLNFRLTRRASRPRCPARPRARADAFGHVAGRRRAADPGRVRERQSHRPDERGQRARRGGRRGARAPAPRDRPRAAAEFYVNDAGSQVDLLGESVAARFARAAGLAARVPRGRLPRRYIARRRGRVARGRGRAALAARRRGAGSATWRSSACWPGSERDLAAYGVTFDRWFRESTLHAGAATLRRRHAGRRCETDAGTSTSEERRRAGSARARFGDDKDRVLVRGNGEPRPTCCPTSPTTATSARAASGASLDLWGPDHHGHVARMAAAMKALGLRRTSSSARSCSR